MADQRQQVGRRTALSKARIVQAAVEILDEGGADTLTFRALAARLSTGAGAIYHHIANKSDLLSAAADNVMSSVLDGDESQDGVRDVMLATFDAITSHPWVGTQLAAAPWQPAVLRLFERVGVELNAVGVPERNQFDAASVLVHQVLGVASQYDAGSRRLAKGIGRPAFLQAATSDMMHADHGVDHPFIARIAPQLADHDDRAQFSAGVEIILAGIATL